MRKGILNAINEFKEVKDLVNKSEIARRFGCAYNTVQKYLELLEEYKMELTEEYIKAGYIYDYFFGLN